MYAWRLYVITDTGRMVEHWVARTREGVRRAKAGLPPGTKSVIVHLYT